METIDMTGISAPVVQEIQRLVPVLRNAMPNTNPEMSVEEMDRILDALATDLPEGAVLPASFSRADIYYDGE